MRPVHLIEANTNDLEAIAALARTVWYQHYPTIIGKDQIEYMLKKMYSAESLTEQMQVRRHRFFFIVAYSKRIGFISLAPESKSEWTLSKFYIDQDQARKGYGAVVFTEAVSLTSAHKIRLTVNRQNYKAINFYFKLGFRITEVGDFDIGGGFFMNDFVMEWASANGARRN